MAKIKQAQEQHANHQEQPSNYIISVVCFTLTCYFRGIHSSNFSRKKTTQHVFAANLELQVIDK